MKKNDERRLTPALRYIPLARETVAHVWSLGERAFTSSLSGLLNKAAFSVLSEQDAASGDERLVAFVDLAGFKAVNDGHGHKERAEREPLPCAEERVARGRADALRQLWLCVRGMNEGRRLGVSHRGSRNRRARRVSSADGHPWAQTASPPR